jgi:hypothetical protein
MTKQEIITAYIKAVYAVVLSLSGACEYHGYM